MINKLSWSQLYRRYESLDEEGRLHSDSGPAVLYTDFSRYWFKHGVLHRDDGPAAIRSNGTKEWFRNGVLHRDDGPAIINAKGSKRWYKNGIPCKSPTE